MARWSRTSSRVRMARTATRPACEWRASAFRATGVSTAPASPTPSRTGRAKRDTSASAARTRTPRRMASPEIGALRASSVLRAPTSQRPATRASTVWTLRVHRQETAMQDSTAREAALLQGPLGKTAPLASSATSVRLDDTARTERLIRSCAPTARSLVRSGTNGLVTASRAPQATIVPTWARRRQRFRARLGSIVQREPRCPSCSASGGTSARRERRTPACAPPACFRTISSKLPASTAGPATTASTAPNSIARRGAIVPGATTPRRRTSRKSDCVRTAPSATKRGRRTSARARHAQAACTADWKGSLLPRASAPKASTA